MAQGSRHSQIQKYQLSGSRAPAIQIVGNSYSEIQKFRFPRTPGSRGSEIQKSGNSRTPGSRNSEIQKLRTPGSRDSEIQRFRNSRTVRSLNLDSMGNL